MAFTSGTATNSLDLLDKLRAWVTGTLGWSQLKWSGGELVMSGPGTVSQPVITQTLNTPGSSSNSWRLNASVSYDSSFADYKNQMGACQDDRFFTLGNAPINYWFYGNSRQFKVVAKMGTLYTAMYQGFHLPFALPDEYPWPYYIGGTFDTSNKVLSDTDAQFRNFWDPGRASMKTESLSWIPVSNVASTSSASDLPNNTNTTWGRTFPYLQKGTNTPSNTYYILTGGISGGQAPGNSLLECTVGNKNSERPIYPIEIQMLTQYSYGSLDGVFCVPGRGLTPEQTITWTDGVTTRTFRVFPNIFRLAGRHWAAFEEV